METTGRGRPLRPVGAYTEAPDGYNGETHSGQLLWDEGEGGLFWVRGINARGAGYLFPVTDQWVACYCTSIGTAPEEAA